MQSIDAILPIARLRAFQGDPDAKVSMKRKSLGLLVAEIDTLRHQVESVTLPNDNAIGKFHSDSHGTERAAALAVYPRSGTQRELVLRAIADSACGLMDHEICRITGMKPNTERPRRVELVQGGWIADSGQTRETGDGGDGIVWVVTEKTRIALKNQWTS